jgi:glycolate oxidase
MEAPPVKDYLLSRPIPAAAYQELESIVGPEYITREPAVLDGYAWQPLWNEGPEMWVHRPVAVVLPASTEEVQAIVKACNRHGLRFKAICTGWGALAGPRMENVVQIELRRMDRILEIDEKNMYVVVEPHAIGGQIIAEAMRKGLHTHIVSSGAASSPLASATSCVGCAPDGTYMNWSSRNLLGVEWVLPDGEIVRLGSLGSGCGWFSGDGPGPSLRGVLRGRLGAFGGNGVFTKCALKLYNWPCQPVPQPDGFMLDTELPLPPNCKVYTLFFPDRNSMADATQAITVEGVGYNAFKPGMGSMLGLAVPHLLHKDSWRKSQGLKTLIHDFNHLFMEVLVTDSPEELDFQESVIREEVARHRGIMLDMEPLGMAEMAFWTFMLASSYPIFFRASGMFITAYGQDESHHSMVYMSPEGEDIKRKWIDKGNILDDGSDSGIHFLMEEGTCSHYEEPIEFDHRDREQASDIRPLEMEFTIMQAERCMESGITSPMMRKAFGPAIANYPRWQQVWAESINPNGCTDDFLYAAEPLEGEPVEVDPRILQKLIDVAESGAWGEEGPPD